MRSKLFVPGSRPELFAKALITEADAVSFDLEDAVPEQNKSDARTALLAFLRSEAAQQSTKVLIVRVNGIRSPHFHADLAAFAGLPIGLLNLPKVSSPQELRDAIGALERIEQRDAFVRPIPLLVNIESAGALRQAADIARVNDRVLGLQLGLADLYETAGIDRNDPSNVHAALFALRMAAAESGRFAYDSAYPNVADPDGFRREAQQARRLGFIGKSCIHPSQIAIANQVFEHADMAAAEARRIVAAADVAAAKGLGAFMLDGRMIDLPLIARARTVHADSA